MLKTWSVSDRAAARSRAGLAPFVSRRTGGGLGASWVYAEGELDMATAPQLEQTLRDARLDARLVVVDLRGLTFMDSAGVHAIVDAGIQSRRAGCRMIVVRAPAQVDAVFTLIGVTEDVEIFDLDPEQPAVQALLQLKSASAA